VFCSVDFCRLAVCTSEICFNYGVHRILEINKPSHQCVWRLEGRVRERDARGSSSKKCNRSVSSYGRRGVRARLPYVACCLSRGEHWRFEPRAGWQPRAWELQSRFWERHSEHNQDSNGHRYELRREGRHDQRSLHLYQVFRSGVANVTGLGCGGRKYHSQYFVHPERGDNIQRNTDRYK